MAHLRVHVREAIIGDDLRRVKVLEFGRVRSGFPREANEQFGAIQIAVMIRGDISNEICRVIRYDGSVMKFDLHGASNPRKCGKVC